MIFSTAFDSFYPILYPSGSENLRRLLGENSENSSFKTKFDHVDVIWSTETYIFSERHIYVDVLQPDKKEWKISNLV